MSAMSIGYDDQMIDRMSSNFLESQSAEEEELSRQMLAKQSLIEKHNREFIDNLFRDNSTTPIKVRNVQITNAQTFRSGFLEAQLAPLLKRNLMTLADLSRNIDQVTRNLVKSEVVENLAVSLNPMAKSIFSRSQATIDIVPVFNILPVKRFYAKTGTNIGNGEGDGYIQFQLKNLFGGGENVAFDASTGTRTQSSYLLNFNTPILNNSNYVWESLCYSNSKKLELLFSSAKVKGVTSRIYTKFDSPVNHEVTLENCWRTLLNQGSKSLEVMNQLGDDVKSSLMYNVRYDTRDSQHLATSGCFVRLGFEYSGLFNLNRSKFFKSVLEYQVAQTLSKHHSLLFSSKAGLLFPFNQSSHVLDRFFAGGPNDVRAFTLNGLGPKNFNSSLGGDMLLSGGISLFSKIPGVSEDSNFKIHNFINFGNLLPIDKTKSVSESLHGLTNQYSIGWGFGILYNHPMARFELNFVLPLATHERDYIRKGVQYGIGVSFL